MDELCTEWKYKGEFLKMGIKKYILPGQTEIREYEVIERINKGDHDVDVLDGINMYAILYSPSKGTKEILLEKNYRPPVDRYCIEFPGGLIDDNETKEEAAIRELKEETGYVGTIVDCGVVPLLPVCSGTGTESTCLLPMIINVDAVENLPENCRQSLECDEFIEIFSIPLDSFPERIMDLSKEGYGIESLVYYMALGKLLKRLF